MTIPYLLIELLVDLTAVVLGLCLMVRAADNRPRLWWGIISTLIGLVFMWENVGWLVAVNAEPTFRFTSLLDIGKMLEFYAVATVIGFFPMASLRPGYLTTRRVLLFLLPSVVVITMGASYLLFDCTVTPLFTTTALLNNIGVRDVTLRLAFFACSVLMPLGCFLYPLVASRRSRNVRRRPTRVMWALLLAILWLIGVYCFFTLSINYFVFNLFGASCVGVALVFAVFYLRSENPFSQRTEPLAAPVTTPVEIAPSTPTEPAATDATAVSTAAGDEMSEQRLFAAIEGYLLDSRDHLQPDYNLTTLAATMGATTEAVVRAIKCGGYSSFREYICHMRLECFPALAAASPHASVKELMYACGFSSRSTFYRVFAEHYGCTPRDALHTQRESVKSNNERLGSNVVHYERNL